ncbi:hypothetical protein AB0425_31015 [Actinosynnema sp. NPDC051121]
MNAKWKSGALAAAAVLAVSAVGVASAERDATGPTAAASAPPEMRQLDFLLGSWRCTFSVPVPGGGPSTTGEVVSTVKPVLGGQWYEWNALTVPTETSPEPKASRWLFGGWNATEGTFTAFYLDDRGHRGVSTSPGARDGHVVFSGPFTTPRGPATYVDDFQPQGRNRFTDTISVKTGDQVTPGGSVDCRRT